MIAGIDQFLNRYCNWNFKKHQLGLDEKDDLSKLNWTIVTHIVWKNVKNRKTFVAGMCKRMRRILEVCIASDIDFDVLPTPSRFHTDISSRNSWLTLSRTSSLSPAIANDVSIRPIRDASPKRQYNCKESCFSHTTRTFLFRLIVLLEKSNSNLGSIPKNGSSNLILVSDWSLCYGHRSALWVQKECGHQNTSC